jgi:hypothetical protein
MHKHHQKHNTVLQPQKKNAKFKTKNQIEACNQNQILIPEAVSAPSVFNIWQCQPTRVCRGFKSSAVTIARDSPRVIRGEFTFDASFDDEINHILSSRGLPLLIKATSRQLTLLLQAMKNPPISSMHASLQHGNSSDLPRINMICDSNRSQRRKPPPVCFDTSNN